MSYRNILVPLDGSRFAEAALPLATRLARSTGARIHLIMAHEPVPALVGMGDTPPLVDVDWRNRDEEHSYLAAMSGELLREGFPLVHYRDLEGAPGPALCEEVDRIMADLVVMATHGRGAIGRLWLGSVADHLVRHLSIPVLLVHPAEAEAPVDPVIRSILVGLDLSPESESILDPVVRLAQITDAHVTLVHVLEPMLDGLAMGMPYATAIPVEVLEEQRTAAQRRLDRLADRLRNQGLSVSARLVQSGLAADGLLETLDDKRFDLLALTTHGRSGVRRLILGSVADKVIRGARKPVLSLRPPRQRQGS